MWVCQSWGPPQNRDFGGGFPFHQPQTAIPPNHTPKLDQRSTASKSGSPLAGTTPRSLARAPSGSSEGAWRICCVTTWGVSCCLCWCSLRLRRGTWRIEPGQTENGSSVCWLCLLMLEPTMFGGGVPGNQLIILLSTNMSSREGSEKMYISPHGHWALLKHPAGLRVSHERNKQDVTQPSYTVISPTRGHVGWNIFASLEAWLSVW